MQLKNKLKVLIIDRGYRSVYEFCEKNNLNYRRINRIANNDNNQIRTDLLVKLCDILDCDINDLLYIEKEVS